MLAIEQLAVMRDTSRERSLLLHDITITPDPFEREEQLQKFYDLAVVFGNARQKLLALDLEAHEKAMLEQQRVATDRTLTLQQRVVDLVQAGKAGEARRLLVDEAVPAHDEAAQLLRALQEHEIGDARLLVRIPENLDSNSGHRVQPFRRFLSAPFGFFDHRLSTPVTPTSR